MKNKKIVIHLWWIFYVIFLELVYRGFIIGKLISINTLMVILFSIPFIVIFSTITTLFNEKINRVLNIILTSVLTLVTLAQIVYYNFYDSIFSFFSLTTGTGQVMQFWQMIIDVILRIWYIFVIILIPYILYLIFNKKFNYKRPNKTIIISEIVAFILSFTGIFFVVKYDNKEYYVLKENIVGFIGINENYIERAEILREKENNRTQFFRGQVAKYNWVDFGDSYLQSDLNAAYLWAQLEMADEINNNRLNTWNTYYEALKPLEEKSIIKLPTIPEECKHNAHMFYIKTKDIWIRQAYIKYMRTFDIACVFHYVPLHSSPAGVKYGRFYGKDEYTTSDSDRLVRLPMYYNMAKSDLQKVIDRTYGFFKDNTMNVQAL